MRKKIPVFMTITIAALFGTICFLSAYFLAYNNVASKVNDLNARTDMFNNLRDVDSAVRNNYTHKIDEDKLIESLLEGYISGINPESIILLYPEEAIPEKYSDSTMYHSVRLSNGYTLIFKK